MTGQKKNFEALLYSVVGVVIMFAVLIAIYVIAGAAKVRVDLTEERLYTLSPGTEAILKKLDTPVQVRFYWTQGSKDMPVFLKTHAQRVEELLEEYKKASKGMIEIKKFDPQPDSDAEDTANFDGVEGQMTSTGDKIYLGLAVSQLDAKDVIPFLTPDRDKLLEYDLSRAISKVTTPKKPVVGIMSPLQVFGEFNPMAMRMGQMQRQDPWVFVGELKRDFDVRQIEMSVTEIPADVQVLVVVHPKGITDAALYALDQFVLRGGKLLAFLDPLSIVDSRSNPQMNPLQAAQMGGSNLDKLTKAWGLEFDGNKVAADMNFVARFNRGNRLEAAPAVLAMTKEGLDANDVVTSQVDSALIPFAGVFTGTPTDGLKQTVLIKTTTDSQLVERFMAEFSGDQIAKDFAASGKEYALAVRLTGKFKTAFPDGKPKAAAPPEAGEAKTEDKADASQSLKESATEGAVILVGDSDMIYDQFCVRIQEFFGQRIIMPQNGNLNLVQNMVEQLAGDSNLIAVRSRATMNRPFTVVRKMQAQAEDRFRNKIKELETSLNETQARLNELQRTKGEGDQRFVLSPEQEAEIQNFKKKQAEANRELRKVRGDLKKEIDSMQNNLKWINIAGMPLLVAISGISLALVKRKRTAAK